MDMAFVVIRYVFIQIMCRNSFFNSFEPLGITVYELKRKAIFEENEFKYKLAEKHGKIFNKNYMDTQNVLNWECKFLVLIYLESIASEHTILNIVCSYSEFVAYIITATLAILVFWWFYELLYAIHKEQYIYYDL